RRDAAPRLRLHAPEGHEDAATPHRAPERQRHGGRALPRRSRPRRARLLPRATRPRQPRRRETSDAWLRWHAVLPTKGRLRNGEGLRAPTAFRPSGSQPGGGRDDGRATTDGQPCRAHRTGASRHGHPRGAGALLGGHRGQPRPPGRPRPGADVRGQKAHQAPGPHLNGTVKVTQTRPRATERPAQHAATGSRRAPGEPIVKFDKVRKAYGDLVVLDDLVFEAAENEKVAIIGPSGSGKTTILRVLMTLVKPDSG